MKQSEIYKNLLQAINPRLFNEYYKEIGDRIVTKEKGQALVKISVNKSYLLRWGWTFVGFGAFLLFFFTKGASFKFNLIPLLILSAIVLPFILVGVRYYRKASNEKVSLLDTEKRLFLFENVQIPFHTIKCFSTTSLPTASPNPGRLSYQLNIETNDKREIVLFRSDSYSDILEVGYYFFEITNITFKPEAKPL